MRKIQVVRFPPVDETKLIDDTYYENELEGFKWKEYFGEFDKRDYNKYVERSKIIRLVLSFILKTFWKLVLHDIIHNNVRFTFRKDDREFLSFSVVNRNKKSSYRTRKFREKKISGFNRWNDFIFFVETDKRLLYRNKRFFIFQPTEKYKDQLKAEVKRGHQYEPAPSQQYYQRWRKTRNTRITSTSSTDLQEP